jgi:DNA-binding beta-propeller fold protein YncE
MDDLQPGDPGRVGGYRLVGRLGTGGMGQVFLAVSPGGRRVAVKLIHPVGVGAAQFRDRFAREIEAARRVGGFHTAPVVDADPYADPPWMVTAYIDGPSLEAAVSRGGPLPPDEVRALGAGLAEGLAAIHAAGLVHRDLKPGKVILAEDGPRIIDFGIARAIGASAFTTAGVVVGTLSYMSPEQVRGDPVMPASDVFSLGSVLAFAATGRAPFGADSPAAIIFRIAGRPPDLAGVTDPGLRELIAGCLAKSPGDRPTVRAVLASLASLAEPGPAATAGTARGAAALVSGGAVPAAGGCDTQDHLERWALAETDGGRGALVPPDPVLADAGWPAMPVRAGRRGRGAHRWRAALIIAVAVAVLGIVVPVLVTRGGPTVVPGVTIPVRGLTRVRDLTLHGPNVSDYLAVAFSPDGQLLAAGDSGTRSTEVWNVDTGRLIANFTDQGGWGATAVAFSPDGKLLAIADAGGSAYLWDVATGRHTATFTDPGGGLGGVAFSPDGTLLAVGEGNWHAAVWDIATGRLALNLRVASGIEGVTFSRDGTLLAAAGRPAFVWDVATGKRIATLYDPGSLTGDGLSDVALSPDGKLLAAADTNGNGYLWDIATRAIIATLTAPGQHSSLNGIAYSPDGTLVATADRGHVYLWDAATGKLAGTFRDPTYGQVAGVAFSPDGRVLAAADSNGAIYVRVTSQLVS